MPPTVSSLIAFNASEDYSRGCLGERYLDMGFPESLRWAVEHHDVPGFAPDSVTLNHVLGFRFHVAGDPKNPRMNLYQRTWGLTHPDKRVRDWFSLRAIVDAVGEHLLRRGLAPRFYIGNPIHDEQGPWLEGEEQEQWLQHELGLYRALARECHAQGFKPVFIMDVGAMAEPDDPTWKIMDMMRGSWGATVHVEPRIRKGSPLLRRRDCVAHGLATTMLDPVFDGGHATIADHPAGVDLWHLETDDAEAVRNARASLALGRSVTVNAHLGLYRDPALGRAITAADLKAPPADAGADSPAGSL